MNPKRKPCTLLYDLRMSVSIQCLCYPCLRLILPLLVLSCYVDGDNLSQIFPVEIDRAELVNDLKAAIVNVNEVLKDVDAGLLNTWKVSPFYTHWLMRMRAFPVHVAFTRSALLETSTLQVLSATSSSEKASKVWT
jgi:hypothetical protein